MAFEALGKTSEVTPLLVRLYDTHNLYTLAGKKDPVSWSPSVSDFAQRDRLPQLNLDLRSIVGNIPLESALSAYFEMEVEIYQSYAFANYILSWAAHANSG